MSDGYASPYDPNSAAMVQWLMSISPELADQVAPMLGGLSQGMLAGLAPDASKLGTTGATNYLQDTLALNFDDALAAYAGEGAYAEGAFDPVTTSNIVDTPGHRRLLQAMQKGTSVDSIIARVLYDGGAPGDAYAEVNRLVREAVAKGTEMTPEQQNLLNQLPRNPDPAIAPGSLESYDINFVNDLARDMNDLAMSDPPEGTFSPIIGPNGELIKPGGERRWIDDGQGGQVLVEYTSEPSKVAQQYIDQGLSLPTDQYTAEGLLGQGWQDQAAAGAGLPGVQAAANQAMINGKQDPMLAARRSEINELPYSGPGVSAGAPAGGGGGVPQITWEDLGIAEPEQDAGDLLAQVNSPRFQYPGMNEDLSGLLAEALGRGSDVSDIINPNNARIGGATGAPPSPQGGGGNRPTMSQTMATLGQPQAGQAVSPAPVGPNGDVSDIMANLGNSGNLATGTGTYGFGGGGMLAPDEALLSYINQTAAGLVNNRSQPPPPPGDFQGTNLDWGNAIPAASQPYKGPGDAPPPTRVDPNLTPDELTQVRGARGVQQSGGFIPPDFSGGYPGMDGTFAADLTRRSDAGPPPDETPSAMRSAMLQQALFGNGPSTTTPQSDIPPDYSGVPGTFATESLLRNTANQKLKDQRLDDFLHASLARGEERSGWGQVNAPDITSLLSRLLPGTQPQTYKGPGDAPPPTGGNPNLTPDELSQARGARGVTPLLPRLLPGASGAPSGGASGGPSFGEARTAQTVAMLRQMMSGAQQPAPSGGGGGGGASNVTASAAPPELVAYNRGVGKRATDARNAARKNLGYRQEDVDAWKQSVDAARNYRSTYYGEEYGRAAGLAYLLRRAGIRPLDRELAARGAAASATGLRPS